MNTYDVIRSMGGRRFLLTLMVTITFTGLLIQDHIDQIVFRDLMIATVAAYITAAGVQKYGEQKVKVAEIESTTTSEDLT